MGENSSVLDMLDREEEWERFIQYKLENQQLNKFEEQSIRAFIDDRKYIGMKKQIEEHAFPGELPVKKVVNKEGTEKKRIVYSFCDDVGIALKFIAFQLYQFDDMFSDNCYAFRRQYGVGNALRRIIKNRKIMKQYCLKADISNYFNSIDVSVLLDKLSGIRERDFQL